MNQDTQKHEQLPALTAPPPRVRRSSPALWLAFLALLGVVALGWLAWQHEQRLAGTREELSRRLAAGEIAQREGQAGAKQDREALDALQAKVGALEAQLAGMQSQQMALETMYRELSHVGEDRLLAEIEQDLSIAAQQLQLAGNVEAALIALSGAEARLARNAQPQFLPLRKLIARDIERLKALPGADVSGIALKLEGTLDAVPNLPLAFEQRPAAQPEKAPRQPLAPAVSEAGTPAREAWRAAALAWLSDLWGELRQLVRIERIDRPDPGLLAPRETFFLRENLKLRLLSARIALLVRDGRSYKSDIAQAIAWLDAYFDLRAPAVGRVRATLESLGKLDVMHEPADLDETLSALRNFKRARDKR